jgi:hypothetical protein
VQSKHTLDDFRRYYLYTGQEIISPVGDVIAKPLQVIRASLSLVSALSSQTDQPLATGINPDSYTLAP